MATLLMGIQRQWLNFCWACCDLSCKSCSAWARNHLRTFVLDSNGDSPKAAPPKRSLHGQPCDQIHHMLRSRLDLVDPLLLSAFPIWRHVLVTTPWLSDQTDNFSSESTCIHTVFTSASSPIVRESSRGEQSCLTHIVRLVPLSTSQSVIGFLGFVCPLIFSIDREWWSSLQ